MKKSTLLTFLILFSFSISAQVIEKPRGCFAGSNGLNPNVLSHPEARGVLLAYKWHEIEVTPGNFNFTNLNNDISAITNAGLKYSLAILGGGVGSPSWLIDSLGANYFSFVFQSQNTRLPLWWDTIVQNRLDILITEIGNQYAQDSMLSHLYVTQMTVNGVEGHLNGIDMNSFSTSGYTSQKWINSAKATTNKYAQSFPLKPIVFEIHEIENDTIVPAIIINDLYNDPVLCKRVGLGMWWISGKITYQSDLIDFISNFQGDKYAQVIGRSDQLFRFKDSLYSTVFSQAKALGIRYLEPWPYEFQNHTHDSLLQDFNGWADANFSSSYNCSLLNNTIEAELSNPSIFIYPNPTHGLLKLLLDFTYSEIEISLFNSQGQEMLHVIGQTELNIHHLAEGVYFVNVKLGKEVHVKKIIKLE